MAQVHVYDVTQEFKCIKTIKIRQGVRTITQADEDVLICGENDGYIDLISISAL